MHSIISHLLSFHGRSKGKNILCTFEKSIKQTIDTIKDNLIVEIINSFLHYRVAIYKYMHYICTAKCDGSVAQLDRATAF